MAAPKPVRSPPGICLLTPASLGGDIIAGGIEAALSHPSSEVIILTSATQEDTGPKRLRDIRAVANRHGKVFLVENDVDLAHQLDAGGVLLAGIEDIGLARKTLGETTMVGVTCGLSRHKAMEAGEAGADFVGLGGQGAGTDHRLKTAGHIAWWNSIFEIPSVALTVDSRADAETFASAGADFLALGDPFWNAGSMVDLLDTLSAGADTR